MKKYEDHGVAAVKMLSPSPFFFMSYSRLLMRSEETIRYDQSRVQEVYGWTISLIVLATFLVIARIIARRHSAVKLWWDDVAIVVALVSEVQQDFLKSSELTSNTIRWLPGAWAHAVGFKLQSVA